MIRLLPTSLKGLLLLNEGALFVLLILCGGVGALSTYYWQQSSAQALRLATMGSHAEHIRGDLYRQIEDVVRASLTGHSLAPAEHAEHVRRIDTRFDALSVLVTDPRERLAADFLRTTYDVLQRDMAGVSEDDATVARARLLDRAQEQWLLAEFESALTILSLILSNRQEHLQAGLDRWKQLSAGLVIVLLAFALGLAVLSLRQLRRRILLPIEALARGAAEFSHGNLSHRILADGVRDLEQLAQAFNTMAGDLERSQQALVEAEREAVLGALVPVVAHNIRNPLASIRATAQVIDARDDPDELAETRQAILHSVDNLERWLRSLLSYLHPLAPTLEAVPFDSVVAAPVDLARPLFDQRGLRLLYRSAADVAMAAADAGLVEQAIFGLLDNAAEASPRGATVYVEVTVRTGDDGRSRWNVLTIDDEGTSMKIQPQLASSGARVRPGATTKSFGTGLGIPFAFKVIQAHGGTLEFTPRLEGGTRVTINIPVSNKDITVE
ncbi:MAG: HAMP domain-containing protein [Gammaproteobacteria bacterium]|nr:HAMP domain-containing protein [Gammaproteobacteria bacterium]